MPTLRGWPVSQHTRPECPIPDNQPLVKSWLIFGSKGKGPTRPEGKMFPKTGKLFPKRTNQGASSVPLQFPLSPMGVLAIWIEFTHGTTVQCPHDHRQDQDGASSRARCLPRHPRPTSAVLKATTRTGSLYCPEIRSAMTVSRSVYRAGAPGSHRAGCCPRSRNPVEVAIFLPSAMKTHPNGRPGGGLAIY